MMNPLNGEIWKVKLYPVRGSEQDGVRPCVVVSPNSMNKALPTVIVIPLTRSLKDWPTRVEIKLKNVTGQACLEHIRSVSKERLIEKVDTANHIEMSLIRKTLEALFSE